MDEKDRLLWTYLQNGIPLVRNPFEQLAAKTGLDVAEVFVRIQHLKREGVLTEITPVWDPRKFHYQSAWVAMRFDTPDLISKTGSFTDHPGVSYACERGDAFNLWFFIAVPVEHDLELHVRCLERMSGAEQTLFLSLRTLYKGTDLLNVLDGRTFLPTGERFDAWKEGRDPGLTPEEIEIIRGSEHFPLTDEPYKKLAGELGLTEDRVMERMKSLVQRGCLRRIGSVPASVETGTKTIVVWQIPEEKAERIGSAVARFNEVLYADQRTAYEAFPYSFYTVLRPGNGEELGETLRRIGKRIGEWPRKPLVTLREFKKSPPRYYSKELEAWWKQHHAAVETAFDHHGT